MSVFILKEDKLNQGLDAVRSFLHKFGNKESTSTNLSNCSSEDIFQRKKDNKSYDEGEIGIFNESEFSTNNFFE
jgi:hypothetical protein